MPRTWQDMSDEELREIMQANHFNTAYHREAVNELHDRIYQRTLAQLNRIEPTGALSPSALATARDLADGKRAAAAALQELGREVVALAPNKAESKPATQPTKRKQATRKSNAAK